MPSPKKSKKNLLYEADVLQSLLENFLDDLPVENKDAVVEVLKNGVNEKFYEYREAAE